jgi:two-component system NtrC family sensor kinase
LKQQILFIDGDLAAQRSLAEEVLAPNDGEHLRALTGEDGLRLLQDRDPDLIILGDRLPDRDGFDLLEELLELGLGVPVVFASSDQSTRTILRAFRLGASDFLAKPFEPRMVLDAIERTLSAPPSSSRHEDLTRRLRDANRQLQARFQELNTVYAIGRAVTSLLDLDQVLNRVVEAAVYTVRAEEGSLMLLDEESNELYLRAAKDVGQKTARNLRLRVDDSAAGQALRGNRPVHLTGDSVKLTTGYLVKSLLYVPLRVPERGAIGVLGVANRWASQPFSQRDITLVSALADYAAIAIENARLFEHAETERAKLEAVLRDAEEAILVVDQDDRVLLCNASARRIWQVSPADLSEGEEPRPVDEVIADSAIKDMFVETTESSEAVHREVALDNERTYKAHLAPVEGVGRVLTLQDITHLKELNRLKTEFVTTVSHDLRTPLTSARGYVELLPQAGPLNERQAHFVARAQESLGDVADLIAELLDVRRAGSDLDLTMEPCDLRSIINEAVGRLAHQAEEKGQDLCWEESEALPLVEGDPQRLRQVVDNLVNNAIKYTQRGGRILVTATSDAGHIVVQVSDNGLGIPAEEQSRIFDKFYRVESEDVTGIDGVGLGLAIVRSIVDRHDGRVWVESNPGEGSTFTFLLPAIEEES